MRRFVKIYEQILEEISGRSLGRSYYPHDMGRQQLKIDKMCEYGNILVISLTVT